MSVVETITQELAQARCQHCGELAFRASAGTTSMLDDVEPDERAAWRVLLRAEEVRRVQPAHPQPALDNARATHLNRKESLRRAQADHDEAERAVGELSIVSRKEKRESAQRALQGAKVRLERAQEEHAAAVTALEQAREVERVRSAYDEKHDEFYRQAAATREELYGRIDDLARRAHQLRPGWLANLPERRVDEDIEATIALTRAVLAYRRTWDVRDQVSPLGPKPSSGAPAVQEVMHMAASGETFFSVRPTYVDFRKRNEATVTGS
ncbi:MAG: hypothetical protein K0S65_4655 [Labilithrix sp.]|jgi:hypothetical protein|nr:hypothetical protein [Labilithrix sp.]